MDHRWILSAPEYYARLNAYILEFELPCSIEKIQNWEEVVPYLGEIFGAGSGRTVLDCTCGWGTQTIPLAKLGWQVTACDISETSISLARTYAQQEDVPVDFQICDLGNLAQRFDQEFDCVVCCKSLYEIPTDEGIRKAIHGMYTALKPRGKCYIELRDMDQMMEEKPRHIFCGEKDIPDGRIICIEDWDYESESTLVDLTAFMREDHSRDPSDNFRWVTETIGKRKKVLGKAELQDFLEGEGFEPVTILPKPEPWMDVRCIAIRPG
jgi:glycine/sarcosine N-methyltransferase